MIGDNVSGLLPNERPTLQNSYFFIIVNIIGLLGPFFVGVSWAAVSVCIALYFVRMFFVSGFLHRYFSHKSYETSRAFQFVMGVLSLTPVQKGPIWWASWHRQHHKYSDKPEDPHSNYLKGFYWSHVGWILCPKYKKVNEDAVKDLTKYPELVWLGKPFVHPVPGILLAVACYFFGAWLGPAYHTSAMQMLVVGFFTSTFLLYHGTFTVNSVAHMFGPQRFNTGEQSRNNRWLGFITGGEGGSHNNHHYKHGMESSAISFWEKCSDSSHYVLMGMHYVGLIDIPKYKRRIPKKNQENKVQVEEVEQL